MVTSSIFNKYLNHQSQFGSCGGENKFNYTLSSRADIGKEKKSIALAAVTGMKSDCLYNFQGVILKCSGHILYKTSLSTHE